MLTTMREIKQQKTVNQCIVVFPTAKIVAGKKFRRYAFEKISESKISVQNYKCFVELNQNSRTDITSGTLKYLKNVLRNNAFFENE